MSNIAPANCLECSYAHSVSAHKSREEYECQHPEKPSVFVVVGNGYNRPDWCKKMLWANDTDCIHCGDKDCHWIMHGGM